MDDVIDIVSKNKIDDILDDSENYVWDAWMTERMDGWVPDVGLTDYVNNSVYRPPSIARAGIRSELRNRIFDRKSKDFGTRYIGILIYDPETEDDYPLDVFLGDEKVGRVVTKRHDNRTHLMIINKAVFFRGSTEVFRVIAPQKGEFRIEKFVLLKNLPEGDSFEPIISNFSAKVLPGACRESNVKIDFVTPFPATVVLKVTDITKSSMDMGKRFIESQEFARIHTLELCGLKADTTYQLDITTKGKYGEISNKIVELNTNTKTLLIQKPITIPVELVSSGSYCQRTMPLTFGVPIPKGTINEVNECSIRFDNEKYMAQARIHSRWNDGSASWILIDGPCPKDLDDQEICPLDITFLEKPCLTEPGLLCEENKGKVIVQSDYLRITVDPKTKTFPALIEKFNNGDKEVTYNGSGMLSIVLGNGVKLKQGEIKDVKLEEAGSKRAVIHYKLPYVDSKGITHIQSTMRVHVYYNNPFIKIAHRLEFISPSLAPVPYAGDLPDAVEEFGDIRSAIAGESGEATSVLLLREIAMNLPFTGTSDVSIGKQQYDLETCDSVRLVHEHELFGKLEVGKGDGLVAEEPVNGHLKIHTKTGNIGLGIKNFWEAYPKGINVGNESVNIQLLPELSEGTLPGNEGDQGRLYFWNENGMYKIKGGMTLTNEIFMAFPNESQNINPWFDWFEQPPMVRPTVNWLNSTGVLSLIHPKKGSSFPEYEKQIDAFLHKRCKTQRVNREYGFMNFGDFYGGGPDLWANNEYDQPYICYLEWLRGGGFKWFDLGNQGVAHLANIDTVNFSKNIDYVGAQYAHMQGHIGGYLPPYYNASKVYGSMFVWSHSWVQGPALCYLLTGDEMIKDTLDLIAKWMSRYKLTNYDFMNSREVGWHLLHLAGLIRLTGDNRYINAASVIMERLKEKGWEHILSAGHCGCPIPRCKGEGGFMVAIALSGLRELHELTKRQEVADLLIDGAHWLIDKTYDMESGMFYYTSCPNKPTSHNKPSLGFSVCCLEGISYAYELTDDQRFKEAVVRLLPTLIQRDRGFIWPRFAPITLSIVERWDAL